MRARRWWIVIAAACALGGPAAVAGEAGAGADIDAAAQARPGASRSWSAQAAATAAAEVGADGRTSGGGFAALAGAIRLDGAAGSRLQGTGTAWLGAGPGAVAGASWDLTARPYRSPLFPLALSSHLDMNARPALDGRLDLWSSRFSRLEIGTSLTGIDGGELAGGGPIFIQVSDDFAWTTQTEPDRRRRRFELNTDVVPVGWVTHRSGDEPDFRIDVAPFSADAVAGDVDAAMVSFYAFRVRGLALAGSGLYLDGALGIGGTGTVTVSVQSDGSTGWQQTINSDALPEVDAGIARLRLFGTRRVAGGAASAGLGYGRHLYVTADDDAAVEDRVAADVSFRREAATVRASGFLARTLTWGVRDHGDARLAGVTGEVEYRVRAGVAAKIDVELASMLPGGSDGAADLPSLGARAFATLTTALGHGGARAPVISTPVGE